MIHILFKLFIWLLAVITLLAFSLFTTVDWTHYKEKKYYKETKGALEMLTFQESDLGFLSAGWAMTNVTPDEPVELVAYKPRGNYEYVEDSSFVKALIVGNGHYNIAYLNYELLIVHPYLASRVEEKIRHEAPDIDKIYFTATHTHSGMGGYIPGLLGKFAMGGFEERVIQLLENKSVEAVQTALADMDTVTLSYRKTDAGRFVMNRLIEKDPVDPYIRQLLFTKNNGQTGAFITFSAHSTCLNSRFMGLSGDYPQYLTDYLEEDNVDFALFAAGTVGSHRPVTTGNDIPAVKRYAMALDSVLTVDSIPMAANQLTDLKFTRLPLGLRSPHFRISDNFRLRPWVFDAVFGNNPAHFDLVVLGNIIMVSSSGEISGVFYERWEELAEKHGYHLIITTFNGGYIGYITPDKYYEGNYYEVRDMNLYGPYNGAYFDEMVEGLVQKAVATN